MVACTHLERPLHIILRDTSASVGFPPSTRSATSQSTSKSCASVSSASPAAAPKPPKVSAGTSSSRRVAVGVSRSTPSRGSNLAPASRRFTQMQWYSLRYAEALEAPAESRSQRSVYGRSAASRARERMKAPGGAGAGSHAVHGTSRQLSGGEVRESDSDGSSGGESSEQERPP